MSVEIPFEFEFAPANARCFVPMDLGLADNTSAKFYGASTLQLPPIRSAVDLVQAIDVLDAVSLGNDFNLLDRPNDLEIHIRILPFLVPFSGIT